MTLKDAQDHLYELLQSAKIPHDFDENHLEYDSALKYTMDNNQFDYKKFNDNKVIIKFGNWQVERNALVQKVGYDYYFIEDTRLWEITDFKGVSVWNWLIHLAEKTWIDKDSVKDLNMAFFFCQDYFKKMKPKDLPYVSNAQTLYIQKQLIEVYEGLSKTAKINKDGKVIPDIENFSNYFELKSEIKTL